MKGHIRQRSKGSWEIAIDVGRDPSTGQRRQHFETISGRKVNAHKQLVELLASIEKGTYVKSTHSLTLGEYLTEWRQSHAELHCRPRTAEGYRFIVNRYLIPALGRMRLNELMPQHVGSYCSKTQR